MNKAIEKTPKAMADRGISYGELSRLTGIPKSALQRYVTGSTEKVPADRLLKIYSALGISLSELSAALDLL